MGDGGGRAARHSGGLSRRAQHPKKKKGKKLGTAGRATPNLTKLDVHDEGVLRHFAPPTNSTHFRGGTVPKKGNWQSSLGWAVLEEKDGEPGQQQCARETGQ